MPRVAAGGRRLAAGGRSALPRLGGSRFSYSVERGLAVLGCFTGERPVWGIAELADELGMGKSTTHRYAFTLVALGYLEQTPGRRYRLGLRCSDLGMLVLDRGGLREGALPHLQALRNATSGTSALAVLDGAEIVLVACARSACRGQGLIDPELRVRAGSRLPSYCTAMGKVLLAALAPGEQDAAVGGIRLVKRAPGTITSKRWLRDELQAVQSNDMLAVCEQELAPDLLTIAVPVCRKERVVAALGIATVSTGETREDLIERLEPILRATAKRIPGGFIGQSTHRWERAR